MQNIKVSGFSFLLLALGAFAGVATEFIWAYLVMPAIFGASFDAWETVPAIVHWVITCITWGAVAFVLIKIAREKFHFDLFEKGAKPKLWQWITVVVGVVLCMGLSYHNWNGFKVVKEFQNIGWLLFIFQYIYYAFEVVLFTLIIVFGQKALETWFKKENFPYGGVLVGLTWGLAHIFSKDLHVGLFAAFVGFLYGTAYLLLNRDIKLTFLILYLMFVL